MHSSWKLQFGVLVLISMIPQVSRSQIVNSTVFVDTTILSIGPVGDLTGQGINNVGLAWEASHAGWNTDLGFDDSTIAGWSNAIEVIHPNLPFVRYWFDGTETVGSSPVYFRKEFDIPGIPTSGLFDLSVDDDAKVYVNGNLVFDDANGLATTIDNINVTAFLHIGQNLLAIKAHDQQGAQGIAGRLDIVSTVPEPSTIVLVLLSVSTLFALRRRLG